MIQNTAGGVQGQLAESSTSTTTTTKDTTINTNVNNQTAKPGTITSSPGKSREKRHMPSSAFDLTLVI